MSDKFSIKTTTDLWDYVIEGKLNVINCAGLTLDKVANMQTNLVFNGLLHEKCSFLHYLVSKAHESNKDEKLFNMFEYKRSKASSVSNDENSLNKFKKLFDSNNEYKKTFNRQVFNLVDSRGNTAFHLAIKMLSKNKNEAVGGELIDFLAKNTDKIQNNEGEVPFSEICDNSDAKSDLSKHSDLTTEIPKKEDVNSLFKKIEPTVEPSSMWNTVRDGLQSSLSGFKDIFTTKSNQPGQTGGMPIPQMHRILFGKIRNHVDDDKRKATVFVDALIDYVNKKMNPKDRNDAYTKALEFVKNESDLKKAIGDFEKKFKELEKKYEEGCIKRCKGEYENEPAGKTKKSKRKSRKSSRSKSKKSIKW